jgi:putative membrane protein
MENGSREEPKKIKLGINDELAMERTIMANERTFLSYIRTALTLLVPGVTGLHLSETVILKVVSSLFIPAGVVVFLIGIARFRKKQKAVRRTGR